MLKTFQIAIRCGCIFALVAPVHANLITHNGVKVFEDTFENQALGQQPATGGISSGVGGWTFSFGTPDGPVLGESILTLDTDSPIPEAPGPFQGNQYIELRRDPPAHGGVYAAREILPVTTGVIHAEMMVYQTQNERGEGSVHFNASPTSSGEGTSGDALFHIYSHKQGRVVSYTTPSAFQAGHLVKKQSGGNLTYELNLWQKWEFDIDLDNKEFSFAIDGERSVTEPFISGNEDNSLRFFGTRAQYRSLGYLDATDSSVATPTSFEWSGVTPEKWKSSLNWTPTGTPDGSDMDATFGNLGSGGTVSTDDAMTVNKITFNNGTPYFIAGGGSINLAQDSAGPTNPVIDVQSGSHQLQVKVNLDADTTISGPGTLDFNNQIDLKGNSLTTSVGVSINHSVVDTVGGGSISNLGTLGADGSAHIAGDLASTGTLGIDLGENSADHFEVVGSASIAGSTIDISLEDFTPAPGQQFTILSAAGGLGGLASGDLALSGDSAGFSLDVAGDHVVLRFAAIPEPASMSLLLVGAMVSFRLRRRVLSLS